MPLRKPFLTLVGIIWFYVLPPSSLSAQGPSWHRVNVGQATYQISAIYAMDTLHIWAASEFGYVLYSRDGGINWTTFALDSCCSPLQDGVAHSFFFFDTLNGWIAGLASNYPPAAESFRLHTTDGGLTWMTQLDTTTSRSYQVLFLNRRRGIDLLSDACHFKDSLLMTDDSGKSWRRLATGIPACSLERFFFLDSLNGWVISSHPAPNNTGVDLIRTRDGGESWSKVPVTIPICSGAKIYFADTLHGWMWHCSPIIPNVYRFSRTTDGGITWDSLAGFDQFHWFNAFKAIDINNFWLAGYTYSSASIQYSSDGGRTWVEQIPGVDDEIISLDAVDCRHAYAGDVNGYVYVYSLDSLPQVGDLNMDGSVSAADIIVVLNYVFLRTDFCGTLADVDFNDDCTASPADVVLLLLRVFVGSPIQRGCAGL